MSILTNSVLPQKQCCYTFSAMVWASLRSSMNWTDATHTPMQRIYRRYSQNIWPYASNLIFSSVMSVGTSVFLIILQR